MSDDLAVLAIAVHHIQAKIATVIVGAVLLGVSSILLCFSTFIFAKRGLRFWSYPFLLTVTVAMYAVGSTYWAIEATTLLQIIRFPDTHAVQSPQSLDNKSIALTVCLGLNIWFSDAIVLWRTLVLWKNHLAVRCASVAIFVAITAVLLADVSTTRAELSNYANTVSHLPIAFRNLFGGIALFLSFGFNIWATCLAGFKAWQYKRLVRQSGMSNTGLTRQSLALLLECGALYIILWAAFIAFSAFRKPEQSPAPSYALDQAIVQICAIYPTIIVVLVSLHKAKEDFPVPVLPITPQDHDLSSRFRPTSLSSAYSHNTVAQSGRAVSMYSVHVPSSSLSSSSQAAGGKEAFELSARAV